MLKTIFHHLLVLAPGRMSLGTEENDSESRAGSNPGRWRSHQRRKGGSGRGEIGSVTITSRAATRKDGPQMALIEQPPTKGILGPFGNFGSDAILPSCNTRSSTDVLRPAN